jgi:SAM-dependent methyltransferase
VKFFWHALSTLVVPDLGCYASPNLIRMLVKASGKAELLYCGDRMWPAVGNGDLVRIEPCRATDARPGMVLVAISEGIPDMLRVTEVRPDGTILLQGDADSAGSVATTGAGILARALLPPRRVRESWRMMHRLRLELVEAFRAAHDELADADPAGSIRHKYDRQASYYADSARDDISKSLLSRITASLPQGGRLLVIGSGTGRECFALRKAGYLVSGIDFSTAMLESSRRTAKERNLEIEFTEADIRQHQEPSGLLSGILFTYGVYSFIPGAADRITVLRKIAGWLQPGGRIFLSARLVRRPYERLPLTLQWMRSGGLKPSEWGASHTRYITPDGVFHRSFVHCLTLNRLLREVQAAGLAASAYREGHFELSAPGTARIEE